MSLESRQSSFAGWRHPAICMKGKQAPEGLFVTNLPQPGGRSDIKHQAVFLRDVGLDALVMFPSAAAVALSTLAWTLAAASLAALVAPS